MKENTNISKLNDLISVIEASCSKEKSDELRELLTNHQINDDLLAGAKLFLDDHNFDVDALISFLATEKSITKINSTNKYQKLLPYFDAASILALLIVGYIFYQNENYHRKINRYTITDNSLPVFASANVSNKIKNNMVNAYKTNNPEQGIQYYKQLNETNTLIDDTTQYLAALLFLENGNYKEANTLFKTINRDYASPKISYFNALALLHLNKKEEAKILLKSIGKTNDTYLAEQATKLLNSDLFFVNSQ